VKSGKKISPASMATHSLGEVGEADEKEDGADEREDKVGKGEDKREDGVDEREEREASNQHQR